MFCYISNISCFLDDLFTFCIHLPAVSPLFSNKELADSRRVINSQPILTREDISVTPTIHHLAINTRPPQGSMCYRLISPSTSAHGIVPIASCTRSYLSRPSPPQQANTNNVICLLIYSHGRDMVLLDHTERQTGRDSRSSVENVR